MTSPTSSPEKHEIKINLPGLLRMLGTNIYSEPDVAVREMIQNAHDTCIVRKTEDRGFVSPRIDISFDKNQKTLTFSDNGAGMTGEELHKYLSTIGEGFTKMQRENLRNLGSQEALLLIGQFGIGLLSAFSIAAGVEVFTKSFRPGSTGFRWYCEGDIHYTVQQAEKHEAGTRLVLHLTDANLLLLDDERLRQAVKRYADFLSVPIFLKGNQVNSITPPWESSKEGKTDFSDYIRARYGLYSLATLPFEISEPLPLSGLLFVPMIPYELSRDFGELDIYISRMFIKDNDKDLLPHWARFIKGIINTPALMPTVSRNDVVKDENYQKIRAMLGDIILGYLSFLQEKSPETLKTVVNTYNNIIKARCVQDDDFFDRICDLVQVSTDIAPLSMKEYLKQSKDVIYYFSERGTGTQHKYLFAHKGLPVIDASWGMEEEFLEKYARRKSVKLERLETGSGAIFQFLESLDDKWKDLERQFKMQVKTEAKVVQFEPLTMPAVLVARPIEKNEREFERVDSVGAELGISSAQIRQMFEKIERQKTARESGDDTILHLNVGNTLMQQLRDMPRNETFKLAITAIYNNAQMFAHHYVSPQNAEIIFQTNNAAISTMIGNSLAINDIQTLNARMEIELNELKRKMPQIRLNAYRSCFFAYPFKEPFHSLKSKLTELLGKKHGIKLNASQEVRDHSVVESIKRQIAESHFGIADISENNPNVMWELGVMIGFGKPAILLKNKEDTTETPFDILGNYRFVYQVVNDPNSDVTEYALLERNLDNALTFIMENYPELEHAEKKHH
ncbi:MAG: ATP-binding protein [Desulfococcaceae bacterium]